MENKNLIEKYRVDVYGNIRNDFDTCIVALNEQANKGALVCCALSNIAQDMATDEQTQIITAAHDILKAMVETMNEALTVLYDCEA